MTRETIEAGSKYENEEYLDLFRIPSEFISSYSSNAVDAANCPLKNAFDGKWNTFWKSNTDNSDTFKNQLSIKFNQTVNTIGYLYQSETGTTRGYPLILKVQYKTNEESSYHEIVFESASTTDKVLFKFGETIQVDEINLVWMKPDTRHKYIASAREIQFIQPENEELLKSLNMFTYNNLELKPEFNSLDVINRLMEEAKSNVNYNGKIKERMERAKNILTGKLKKNNKREFTTNPENTETIYIKQEGDLKHYANTVSKMIWAGLNRQPTGIYGHGGDEIIVYVDALPTDPLPKIVFTQFKAHYTQWHSTAPDLKIGKNVLTFPKFDTSKYAVPTVSGGPIYIVNPYYKSEQSSNVKIYIESGIIFPVFRKGDDPGRYIQFAEDYLEYYRGKEKLGYYDICELYGDRTLHTIDASRTLTKYRDQGLDPNENLENWDKFLLQLFTFDGIQVEKSQPYYDPRAIHMGINFRYAQKYGVAYGANDHIGIFFDEWLDAAAYGKEFGWGYAHEIGHVMDVSPRIYGEATNNMISKFYEDAVQRLSTRGNFEESVIYLTPDGIHPMERNEVNGTKIQYWKFISINFLVWWHIESYFHGYWGNLDNIFRYEQVNETGMTRPEVQVLYSSLAVGYDLSYYFERWGYDFKGEKVDAVFSYENSSSTFKNYMQKFISEKKIKTDKKLKLWYLDRKQYNFFVDNGKVGCGYSTSQKINIERIIKLTDTSYLLRLPTSTCISHLGYEIYINGVLKNFTYDNYFKVENVSPDTEFSIAAYDRLLDFTATSDPKKYEDFKGTVCKINNKNYDDLQTALNEVQNGEKIVIISDIYVSSTLTINRNINITIEIEADKSFHIYRVFSGNLLVIENGSVTLLGKSLTSNLIIDGIENINGRLIIVKNAAQIKGKYLTVQNAKTTEQGGCIHLETNATIDLSYSKIHNCQAERGGGVHISSSKNRGTIDNVKFTENSCTNLGGALRNVGTLTIKNSEFSNGSEKCKYGSAISNDGGGVLDIINSTFTNNKATYGVVFIDGLVRVNGCIFTENTAVQGSAFYLKTTRKFIVLYLFGDSKIYNNQASDKSAIYIYSGLASISGAEIHDNTKILNKPTNTGRNRRNLRNNVNLREVKEAEPDNDFSAAIYLGNGVTLDINSGLKMNGAIYVGQNAKLIANSSMPSSYDNEKPVIKFPVSANSVSVLQANNFILTQDSLNEIEVKISGAGGEVRVDPETNQIKVDLYKCNATVLNKVGDTIHSTNSTGLVDCGTQFNSKQYTTVKGLYYTAAGIKDENGNSYGSQIKGNGTIIIQFIRYHYIELVYSNYSFPIFLKPGKKFYIPSLPRDDEDYRFVKAEISAYVDDSGRKYKLGEAINVDKDIKLYALYDGYPRIKLIRNNMSLIYYDTIVEFGSLYQLPKVAGGVTVDSWYLKNGTVIKPGTVVEIISDITFYADKPETKPERKINLKIEPETEQTIIL